jgi:hypothetical protein
LDLIEAEIHSGDAKFGSTHVQDSNKKIWSILVCRKLGVFVTLVINNIIFPTPGSRCRYGSSNHNQMCQGVEGFVKVSLSNPDYKRTGRLDKGQGFLFVITGMNSKQLNFCFTLWWYVLWCGYNRRMLWNATFATEVYVPWKDWSVHLFSICPKSAFEVHSDRVLMQHS